MDIKQVMSFVKIEHTLFSLPFIIIGFIIAADQFYPADEFPYLDLVWILVAGVGARGLAMTLNRIIDREIDAQNPRTEKRHLASGSMSTHRMAISSLVFSHVIIWRMEIKRGCIDDGLATCACFCDIPLHEAIYLVVPPMAWIVPWASSSRRLGRCSSRFSWLGRDFWD